MDKLQELTKNAPKFEQMERGELVAYAYGLFAAGTKADAENDKLRELVREAYTSIETLCEIVENSPGCYMCPTNQDEDKPCGSAVIYGRMRDLGIEVPNE